MPQQMVVEGPGWCSPGLDIRGGRYPLAVESPVLRMVDTLVPGVSTLTRIGRYYSLYWALAGFAARRDLNADACRALVRRSEVALGWLSLGNPAAGFVGQGDMHGADRIRSLVANGDGKNMAEVGPGSYSPRPWGFWSQYGGPCVTLGAVQMHKRALRPGTVACPEVVAAMFEPLFEICVARPVQADDLIALQSLATIGADSFDAESLRWLLTSSEQRESELSGNDETRRAAFRILARCAQLKTSDSEASWTEVLRAGVAYGAEIETDEVLANEPRTLAWRGTLLRHHFVGAWRAMWADLVEDVASHDSGATRADLHDWITSSLREVSVRQFVAELPKTRDADGHPIPAESELPNSLASPQLQIALLLTGAQRDSELEGVCLSAFRGGARQTKQFLDPRWVDYRRDAYLDRPLGDFARVLVDDMLAQSHRVALRKMRIGLDGKITMFSKLHQRENLYFTSGSEGRGNVGLRTEQIGSLAEQLGLVSIQDENGISVTTLGLSVLGLGS
ncbi:hypothetical protein GIY30_23730 [Gordonia sp. HNM0687]|uniref:Uncharacterized protein n=1 Tax=Gordonia mangrovi TaxID=2665643 RepID=A0A6L7GWJ2_9ACTN|nr:hypothetical protein [Gordonia mangrovi]MXP24336.1 hypothetical protein [Gordonia mangrovi]UVF80014.1 hypothetical protein NWF22_09405 [Gordonia mangrovi]